MTTGTRPRVRWPLFGTGMESLPSGVAQVLTGLAIFLWQRRVARLRPPATS